MGNEKIKLKPCPFCGNKKVKLTKGITGAPFLFFKCENCDACVSFDNFVSNTSPAMAVGYWNTREGETNVED